MSITVLMFLIMFTTIIKGLDNGLARTPPMGWLSWERYRCNTDCKNHPFECISEWLIRNVTDSMVEGGYLDVGYTYVIIDDCWLAHERDKAGDLQPDPDRFPNGIKALADYVHSKGLKFGIYEDYGTKTCAGYPGILGNLERDANKFAEWGVDYVKIDGCNCDSRDMDTGYPKFGHYLNQTARPMVYSCSWPAYQGDESKINYTLIAKYCNLWRNYNDIEDSWDSVKDIFNHYAQKQNVYIKHAGPGHWNDPDMLIIGNKGLNYDQSKVQMAVWAVLAAPLLMSTDLKAIQPQFKAILQNKDIIAVNQDVLGIQGQSLFVEQKVQVWARPVMPMNHKYHSYAVAFVNTCKGPNPQSFEVDFKQLKLYNPKGYNVKDLYNPNKTVVMTQHKPNTIKINPNGVVFLLFEVIADEVLK